MVVKSHTHKTSRSSAGSRGHRRERGSPGWPGSDRYHPSRTPPEVLREYLSVQELSDYSGIGVRKLRDLLKEGLPHHRVGSRIIRIKRSKFDEWMDENHRHTDVELDLAEEMLRRLR